MRLIIALNNNGEFTQAALNEVVGNIHDDPELLEREK